MSYGSDGRYLETAGAVLLVQNAERPISRYAHSADDMTAFWTSLMAPP